MIPSLGKLVTLIHEAHFSKVSEIAEYSFPKERERERDGRI